MFPIHTEGQSQGVAYDPSTESLKTWEAIYEKFTESSIPIRRQQRAFPQGLGSILATTHSMSTPRLSSILL